MSNPLPRVSALNSLAKCPGLALLPSESGKAADTGTATGRLIELHHRGFLPVDALATLEREMHAKCPKADVDQARAWVECYVADPRNAPGSLYGDVVGELCEAEVHLSLPALGLDGQLDPNAPPVEWTGHIDQVRKDRVGALRVWDVKTGRDTWKTDPGVEPKSEACGLTLLWSHAWQLAGYALACTQTWGQPVLPGGIIRIRGYEHKRRKVQPDPAEARVFYDAPWSLAECREMLDTALWDIAALRNGIIPLRPGAHCLYCPGEQPHLCGRKLAELVIEGLG